MRIKNKYREIKPAIAENNIPAEEVLVDIPRVEVNGVKAEPVAAVSIEAPADVEPVDAVAAAIEASAKADEAKNALVRQLEAMRQSEALQRQHAAQLAAQRPATREERLAMWKQQGGMSEAEAKFLEANPELVDIPELTAAAAAEATRQGHQRGSEAHMETTKKLFHEHVASMQAQAAAPATTPAFFQPPPAKPPAPRAPAHYVSAPVSREVPSGGDRAEVQIDPRRVTLTQDELQIAQASGITPQEYARQKLRLKRELASGQRQQ